MSKILFSTLFLLAAFTSFAQTTYLHCGKLIDAISQNALTEMTIVVNGNKITDLRKGYEPASAGINVIDLKNRTVMPGLIDAHVHLSGE